MGAKKIIKKAVTYSRLTYWPTIEILLAIQKIKLWIKSNSLVPRGLYTQKNVLRLISLRKELKKSTVCHIIGSGWSLNKSYGVISDSDFVIGFNYAGLIGIPFDVYFIEFAGKGVSSISKNHFSIVKDYVSRCTDLIFFKNIRKNHNEVAYFNKHLTGISKPIKDVEYPLLDNRHLDDLIIRMLEDEGDYLPQMKSSVITAVVLSYKLGFKDIVIHGLDFGGEYFYEELRGKGVDKYIPSKDKPNEFYSASKPSSIHPTEASALGMSDLIPIFHRLLKEKGVNLYCAVEISPSSRYLPIYTEAKC